MRLSRCVLFIPCIVLLLLLASTIGKAQTSTLGPEKVSFNYSKTSLSQVIKDLEQRYALHFSYSNDQVLLSSQVSCKVNSLPLEKAISLLCSSAHLSYQIVGEQIVLRPLTAKEEAPKVLTQTVRGLVVDNALQTPLVGATVILSSENPVRVLSTGLDGTFKFTRVPVGRHTLKVTYIGYQERELSNLLVISGKETVVRATLEENFETGAEVFVEAESDKSLPENSLISSSVHTLRTEEINRFAGSRQDPSRMAANYAGVISGSDQRNDLIVRGNSPLGVLWRLEGVEIPNPNHFTFTPNTGGAFSLLNNNMLSNSDFLTGAFPAEYGNRIGAIMDMKMRHGNSQKFENTIQIGLNGLEFMTEGPLVRKWGGSFLASVRAFTFKPLEKLNVDIGFNGLPQYQDGSFKIELPSPKTGTFKVWGIGGSSSITVYDIDPDTTTWGKVRYRLEPTLKNKMFAFGFENTFSFSPKTVLQSIVSATGSQVEANTIATYRNHTTNLFYYLRNWEKQFTTKLNLTHKLLPHVLLKGGLTWQRMLYDNQEINYLVDRDVYEMPLDAQGSASLLQAYLHTKWTINPQLDVQAGLYAQEFSIGKRYAIEPRVSFNYYITDAQRVYLSTGFYSQTQPLVYYEYKFFSSQSANFYQPYNKLDFTRSRQLTVGYNLNITPSLRFKAEGYYQYHFHVPVSKRAGEEAFSMLNIGTDYSFVTVDSVVSQGQGRNYGIEFTVERFLKHGFYGLANASFLQSWFTGGDGVKRPTTFSVGHISNLLLGKEFQVGREQKHLLSCDLRLNFAGGRRIIPIDEEKTLNEFTDRIYYDVKNAYLIQLRNYFRTDVRVSYQLNKLKSTHWFYIAADNIFNSRNELGYGWDMEENRARIFYQLGIYPYLGYRIQF